MEDDIENGMVLDNEEHDRFSEDDYEYYWQDDWRKAQQEEEESEN